MIYLKDHKQIVLEECLNRNSNSYINSELIKQALNAQCDNNLRYSKGKTFDNSIGKIGEYVSKNDIPKYVDNGECAKWEFSNLVRNSASRLQRGYTAI
jgi:hypothetical protein